MDQNITPKNGDFAAYVEQLTLQSYNQLKNESINSAHEHERHAAGADLNSSNSAKTNSQNTQRKNTSKAPNNKGAAKTSAAAPSAALGGKRKNTSQSKVKTNGKSSANKARPSLGTRFAFFVIGIAFIVYLSITDTYLSKEIFYLDYAALSLPVIYSMLTDKLSKKLVCALCEVIMVIYLYSKSLDFTEYLINSCVFIAIGIVLLFKLFKEPRNKDI